MHIVKVPDSVLRIPCLGKVGTPSRKTFHPSKDIEQDVFGLQFCAHVGDVAISGERTSGGSVFSDCFNNLSKTVDPQFLICFRTLTKSEF